MTTYRPADLARHLARARAAGIALRRDGDHYRASSETRPGAWYAVRPSGPMAGTCSCPAGQAGTPCKHLAAAISAEHKRQASDAAKLLAAHRDWLRSLRAASAPPVVVDEDGVPTGDPPPSAEEAALWREQADALRPRRQDRTRIPGAVTTADEARQRLREMTGGSLALAAD